MIEALDRIGWQTVDGTQGGAPISNPDPWPNYKDNWQTPGGYKAAKVDTSDNGKIGKFARLFQTDPNQAFAVWERDTPFAQQNQNAVKSAVFGGDQAAMNRWLNGASASNEFRALNNNTPLLTSVLNGWFS